MSGERVISEWSGMSASWITLRSVMLFRVCSWAFQVVVCGERVIRGFFRLLLCSAVCSRTHEWCAVVCTCWCEIGKSGSVNVDFCSYQYLSSGIVSESNVVLIGKCNASDSRSRFGCKSVSDPFISCRTFLIPECFSLSKKSLWSFGSFVFNFLFHFDETFSHLSRYRETLLQVK